MRQKMINLCPTTFEQAAKMANFSEWVRMKLKEEFDFRETSYLHLCIKGCQKVTEYPAPPMCPQHRVRMKNVPSIPLGLVGTE
jgi:hypothetical protein